jgi:AraC-like DNA-binding protein
LRRVQVALQREGTSPSALICRTRLELARDLLSRPGTTTAVAHASEFRSIDAFEKAFRRHYGITPSSYRGHPLIPRRAAGTVRRCRSGR